MGDRVAVLKDGILQQCDSPRHMYDHPNNVFVAGFIGSPAMNLLEVDVTDGGVLHGHTVPIAVERPRPGRRARTSPWVSVPRTSSCRTDGLGIPVTVDVVEELGADAYIYGPPSKAARGHRRERRRRAVHRARRRSSSPGEGREDLPRAEAGSRARLRRPSRACASATDRERLVRNAFPYAAGPAPFPVPAQRHTRPPRAASRSGACRWASIDGCRRACHDDRVTLEITTARPESALLDLPWSTPLEEWPETSLAALPRGISRHVVRFVKLGPRVLAVKEIKDDIADREYAMLRSLRRLDVPSVEPFGVVHGRTAADGEPLDACLVTAPPAVLAALPRALQPEPAPRHRRAPHRRPRRAPRAPAPRRLLVGRRARCPTPSSAATRARSRPTSSTPRPASCTRGCPTASASTTSTSPGSTSPAS